MVAILHPFNSQYREHLETIQCHVCLVFITQFEFQRHLEEHELEGTNIEQAQDEAPV